MAPDRYYLVTFDLIGSKGREGDYARAHAAITLLVGGGKNYYRIVKQCCMVRTRHNAARLRDSLKQTLGGSCNILVVRLRGGYAYSIKSPLTRAKATEILAEISSSDG